MEDNTEPQREAFEQEFRLDDPNRYVNLHASGPGLRRYLRDRRLHKALGYLLRKHEMASMEKWSVLTICGGAGGEGIFFLNNGFADVTVSDFSENALEIARAIDPRLKTLWANAEAIGCEDGTYDLVVVQDGLHHLPRPVLGFTEMLRVSRVAVIVIEPHLSIVGSLIGTEWENLHGAINYVFRWNRKLAEQVVKSLLLQNFKEIKVFRFWDHGLVISKVSTKFPSWAQLAVAKSIYRILSLINFAGNMFVCVVRK